MNFEQKTKAAAGEVKRVLVRGMPELWCVCGACGKKLLPVGETTRIAGLTVKCRGCGAMVGVSVGGK